MAPYRKVKVIVFPPAVGPLLALAALCLLAAALAFSPLTGPVSLYYGSPLKGITVAIDPGHGGIDSGTHFESVMLEKEIVLEIGLEPVSYTHLDVYKRQSMATVIPFRGLP